MEWVLWNVIEFENYSDKNCKGTKTNRTSLVKNNLLDIYLNMSSIKRRVWLLNHCNMRSKFIIPSSLILPCTNSDYIWGEHLANVDIVLASDNLTRCRIQENSRETLVRVVPWWFLFLFVLLENKMWNASVYPSSISK